ncbi:phosphoethanolamine transferase [Caldimonas manganoxidans]|uniref:phosphoethanolamine transferase n=1 Tax=Caldimonas manganoxidans TaxID=196015 RepID=UPI00036A56F6|nr:phosphoethanolamine--lipid A transferase [Caldimonas manganoxidans]
MFVSFRLRPAVRAGRAVLRPCPAEVLIVGLSLWWLLMEHHRFFGAVREHLGSASWGVLAAWMLAVLALNVVVLSVLAPGRAFRPVAVALTLVAAVSSYYVDHYGVFLDPSMLRNVLHTQPAEARELLGAGLFWHVLVHAGPPSAVVMLWPLSRRSWPQALAWRAATVLGASVVLIAVVMATFQPLASLMRNHKELRYWLLPAAPLWSVAKALTGDARQATGPRTPLGLDAQRILPPGPRRPRVVVLVVGETARAANWGLNGYARQTTPGLAERGVINVAPVQSCGTNTEVSVPCLFAPVGRRDYDEDRIRRSESLLHVLARAGWAVQWIDNQTGCKGVCEGLPYTTVAQLAPPQLCHDGTCWDEGLLTGLDDRLKRLQDDQVLVLHMLGNHGPSYFRRYPSAFARFQPECREDELQRCSREAIVNAYDNALLYTDHVLSRLIDTLKAHAAQVDSAMLYVSDHGESLGEAQLYLHGLPYAIAPAEQTRVPMVMWFSPGYAAGLSLDEGCLRQRALQGAAHDHVFHTVLALAGVSTALYEPAWDLIAGCRRPPAAAQRPAP